MSDSDPGFPTIRVVMMPRDTNPHGTIFGGVLLSYIDQAGAIGAREHAQCRFVTVAMDSVEFQRPVFVGDVLTFYTSIERTGRTSLTVRVRVWAQRFADPREVVAVTEALITYVAVDENRQPVPHGLEATAEEDAAARGT